MHTSRHDLTFATNIINPASDSSCKIATTAGLPAPQSLGLQYSPSFVEDSLLNAQLNKGEVVTRGRRHRCITSIPKHPCTEPSMHKDPSFERQSLSEFTNYLDSFITRYRERSVSEIPLKSDGVTISVSSPNWSTLVYLTSRANLIHEISTGTILELFHLVGSQLDEFAAIESGIYKSALMDEIAICLLKTLNAAIVSLLIMSSDGINRCLILDELLQKTVLMLKLQTARIIVPLYDESVRKKMTDTDTNFWQSFERAFIPAIRVAGDLLRRLNWFYLREKVPECHAISVIDVCCAVLSLPRDHELKTGAMWLFVTCFIQHESLREIIIEEITTMVSDEGVRGTSLFRIDSRASIHFPFAVAIILIQSLSAIPSRDKGQRHQNYGIQATEGFINELSDVIDQYSKTLVASLMSKALKPGRSLSDSRSSLQLVVDDLFSCLFLPTWPAAETLLATMLQFLRNMYFKENVNHSRLIAVEFLGLILAKLQNHIAAVERDVSVIRPRTEHFNPSSTIHSNPDEKVGCDCGLGVSRNYLMLDCDECHYWFHGKCVDISDDNIPDSWICSSCELRHSVEQQRSVMSHVVKQLDRKSTFSELSEDDIMFQTLLNYLNTNCIDFSMRLAKDYILAIWCKRGLGSDPAKVSQFYTFFANEKFMNAYQDLDGTSRINRNQALRISRLLSRKYSLLHDSDMHLKVFVNMLSDKQPGLRSKIVKALSQLVEANVDILGQDYITRAVSAAVQDKATSVREAAVEILGKKMLANLSLSERYYPVIASRIRDKGLSVRKRCVKILRNICIEYPDHSKYVDICTKLISRTQDEPSVCHLVQKSLHELWFSQFMQSSSRKSSSSGKFQPSFQAVSSKIVDVVAALPSLDWLSEIITNTANSGSEANDANIVDVYSDICSCIVQNMIALSSPSKTLHHIRTLYVFCCARPTLLLEHFSCLQPMLKVERAVQGHEQSRLSLLCSIFLMTLPYLENPRQRLIANLSTDLKELILQQSASVLLNAVPCLCVLSSKTNEFSLPQQLLRSFYQYLCQYKDEHKLDGRVARSVIRSLISVGLLVRNMSLDFDEKITYCNVTALYRKFFCLEDPVIRRTSLQGLFYCYFRKPSLLVSTCDIITSALSCELDLELHAQVFHSFADFLQNESDQLKYLQGLQGGSDSLRFHGSRYTVIRRDGDGETESGVIVSIVQRLFPLCIKHVQSSCLEVRNGVLRLIQLLLKQRLVNPSHCVPSLIALCSDQSERIANLALVQISEMCISFPDMVRNSIVEGIKKIASFQNAVAGNSIKFLEDDYPSVLLRLFETLSKISHNMHSILVGILNLINIERDDPLVTVEFVLMLLSGLALQNAEPLHLFYHVTRMIGIHGASVDEQLRSALKTVYNNLPLAAQELCVKADKIEMLVHFKRFLQDTYNIVDASPELWNPNQKSSFVCIKKEPSYRFSLNVKTFIPQTFEQLAERYKKFKKTLNFDNTDVNLGYSLRTKGSRRKASYPDVLVTPKRRRRFSGKTKRTSAGESDSDFDDLVIVRSKGKITRKKTNVDRTDSSSSESESSV